MSWVHHFTHWLPLTPVILHPGYVTSNHSYVWSGSSRCYHHPRTCSLRLPVIKVITHFFFLGHVWNICWRAISGNLKSWNLCCNLFTGSVRNMFAALKLKINVPWRLKLRGCNVKMVYIITAVSQDRLSYWCMRSRYANYSTKSRETNPLH